jgi:hypothetical protein
MAGLLLLWLAMQGVCGPLREKRIALFGDNSPSISWVARLASKWCLVAKNLVQALALCLKIQHACPLTPIHVEGKRNANSDVPSQSFGSNPAWKCNTDNDLLTLFNPLFPLPNQNSWTIFCLNCEVVTHVTSTLRTKPFDLTKWRRLLKVGRHIGQIGAPMSNLWRWIRTLTTHPSKPECDASRDLPSTYDQDSFDRDDRYKIVQSLRQSQPLAR